MGQPLVDLERLALGSDVVPESELRAILPHRAEFQLIDGIRLFDRESGVAAGYKQWDEDPWWAKGHVPGRPLMPGVLMIEGAAQIATFVVKAASDWARERMIGLAGLDEVRFRGQIVPPALVWFIAKLDAISGRRLAKMTVQVVANGQVTMEARMLGVML